jgi:glycosyltransferase involved in cell wall biosynthesis
MHVASDLRVSGRMKKSDITVVMPAFNKERFVARAIYSVLSQTIWPRHVIVVDDGSTDGTAIEVKKCRADAVEHLYQPNRGLAVARNAGIQKARTEFIGLLYANDEWKSCLLEDAYELFEKYTDLNAGVCYV